MRSLKKWVLHQQTDNQVDLLVDDKHLFSIYVLDDNLFRVWLRVEKQSRLARTWSIPLGDDSDFAGRDREDLTGFACPHYELIEEDGRLILQTQALRLSIEQPLCLTWFKKTAEGQWKIIAKDRPTGAYIVGRSSPGLAHYMQADRVDNYYGLGEKAGPVDRQGRRYEMRNLDALGYNAEFGDPLYKHWPFYQVRTLSDDHYGMFYDNLATSWFDLGNERDNYHGSYRSYRVEDGDLDYYFFTGESVKAVTKRFVQLTGRHRFLPKWSLGYSGSTMHYTDAPDAQVQLQKFITLCQEHDIPCDSFQLSSGYTSIGDKRYVFHWNRDKVPEPEQLTQAFHKAGMKLAANIKPCLLNDHPQYQVAAEKGLFVRDSELDAPEISMFWDAEGSHLDFTNPDTIRWWQDNVREQLLSKGIDSTWNDNNEYEVWDNHARCYGFGQTTHINLIRPLMSLLMSKASYQAQLDYAPELRPYLISRSGCPGIQRYVQTWTGDNATSWHTLKWNIRMGIGMSLSGMYHVGHDIGGFAGKKPEPELFVRWIQSCLLLPRFTIHSWNDDHTVNEPWMYPQYTKIVREQLQLRYRLLPYLYTLLWQSSVDDEPIIRSTFLEFPNDDNCYQDSDDYMIGEALLLAPVTVEGQRVREVYLPNAVGGWYDYHDETYLKGGQTIECDAALDRLPMFVKAGSIISEGELMHADSPNEDKVRILRVFPAPGNAQSSGTIFDDDGLSHAWLDGQYYQLDYHLNSSAEKIELTLKRQGEYQPAYNGHIRIQLPADEQRPLIINGQPHDCQKTYSF